MYSFPYSPQLNPFASCTSPCLLNACLPARSIFSLTWWDSTLPVKISCVGAVYPVVGLTLILMQILEKGLLRKGGRLSIQACGCDWQQWEVATGRRTSSPMYHLLVHTPSLTSWFVTTLFFDLSSWTCHPFTWNQALQVGFYGASLKF